MAFTSTISISVRTSDLLRSKGYSRTKTPTSTRKRRRCLPSAFGSFQNPPTFSGPQKKQSTVSPPNKSTKDTSSTLTNLTTALLLSSYTLPASAAVVLQSNKPFWLDAAFLLAGPGLFLFNTVMVFRIVLTWYPQAAGRKPWIFLVVPTEPLLQATRKVVKPMGGVDISPIVWFAIGSFLREILVGPQGILNLIKEGVV